MDRASGSGLQAPGSRPAERTCHDQENSDCRSRGRSGHRNIRRCVGAAGGGAESGWEGAHGGRPDRAFGARPDVDARAHLHRLQAPAVGNPDSGWRRRRAAGPDATRLEPPGRLRRTAGRGDGIQEGWRRRHRRRHEHRSQPRPAGAAAHLAGVWPARRDGRGLVSEGAARARHDRPHARGTDRPRRPRRHGWRAGHQHPLRHHRRSGGRGEPVDRQRAQERARERPGQPDHRRADDVSPRRRQRGREAASARCRRRGGRGPEARGDGPPGIHRLRIDETAARSRRLCGVRLPGPGADVARPRSTAYPEHRRRDQSRLRRPADGGARHLHPAAAEEERRRWLRLHLDRGSPGAEGQGDQRRERPEILVDNPMRLLPFVAPR